MSEICAKRSVGRHHLAYHVRLMHVAAPSGSSTQGPLLSIIGRGPAKVLESTNLTIHSFSFESYNVFIELYISSLH